ncbi:valine--tRNA ligase [Polycyclovorans algicola]|uniref:valine--tRNA ligase n=1 Tax=Polycyclovorans algicola TaxID=616992 RepID=UPI0004A6BBCA|nr:valine--tRNA ligase [Polycyclovorans algicola]
MDKTFEPAAVEARWRQSWEADGCFAAGQHAPGDGAPYSIMIPPPNVTGTLHMGHAFQHTIMDALIRHARMSGKDTLWQPGTDHAGIATQMVVERNLKQAGEPSRAELGRKQFLDKVWEWKKYSAGTISEQIRRMGSSVDWSRDIFTMGNPEKPRDRYPEAVIEHFVKLHEDGLIYRGKRLVNWDPVLQTAISDLEVVQEDEKGHLWHFRYPLADGSGHLVVATTRPETMLGDTAVAVHPEDERFKHLIGKTIRLPLVDREIPIIGDDYVDPEFGSGCVKITPAHDFNDWQVGLRHGLRAINLFTKSAHLKRSQFDDIDWGQRAEDPPGVVHTGLQSKPYPPDHQHIPEQYRGLDRFEARVRIVADIDALGLLEKVEDHTLKVPRGDRSGAVLEPYLTDQWFVDLTRKTLEDGRPGGWAQITQPALDAVASGRIQFVPDNWKTTYNHWLNNIQDWCISRQLWWGHRIPAWYDAAGRVYVGRSEAEVRAKHALGNIPLTQDDDVFDTWFSSDIWPFATLGWPEKTPELSKYYPSAVLVTGFDIIFFWVARMVMMGQYFQQEVPFREVYITGLVRDPEGNKMSKSKGNVLDPLDVVDGITLDDLVAKRTTGLMQPEMAAKIEKKSRKDYPDGIAAVGVDALRFTFAALATQGRDIRFDASRAEGYRNFCNKIWNAARFVLMQCEDQDCGLLSSPLPQAGEGQGEGVGAADGSLLRDAQPSLAQAKEGHYSLTAADRWIISQLQRVELEAAEHFKNYRFDLLATALYQFIWNEYCDWYLELSKPALQTGTPEQQRGTRRTLVRVLETALRLLHPIMPFLTEEVWQKLAPLAGKTGATIMHQPYPVADTARIDTAAEADIDWLKTVILGIRQIRGEMDLSPGKPLPLLIQNASDTDRARLARLEGSIRFLARIESVEMVGDDAPESAVALCGTMKLLVPMAGLIDKEAELTRLDKALAKLNGDREKTAARVGNPNFGKAPEHVQQLARDLLAKQDADLAQLAAQRRQIEAM